MDLNLAVLSGRLAAQPELRVFDSGSTLVRLLVTVRSEHPRSRVDVIPVTVWDAQEGLESLRAGHGVWLSGAVQRRFWDGGESRRSRLEVVAEHVCARVPESAGPSGGSLPVP